MKDLRTLLSEHARSGALRTMRRRVDPALEASRLIQEAEPAPILLEDVAGAKVLGNLLPDREALARGLGVDPARFLPQLSDILGGRSGRGGDVRRSDAVYGEVEIPLAELGRVPFLTYYKGDGGPYLTSGVWFVRDPKHGENLSYHRMMLGSGSPGNPGRRTTVRVVERRGTDTALKNSGGRLEAAVCVGAPAHVLFCASLSPALGVCELDLAAKFAPVELARCKTVDLHVPASSELVIEGRFTGETGPEGPFVDITGTVDFVREQPVFEITRVACRKDPVHYAIVPGRSDHKTLMGVPKELDIYREVGKACECLDVRITPGGCSWLHAAVKIAKRGRDDGRKALEAAFSAHRSLKHCVVVDEDIDAGNPADVEWAIATRLQADVGTLLLKDQPGSSLDPSARHEPGKGSRGAKLGLDATIPADADPSLFKRLTRG